MNQSCNKKTLLTTSTSAKSCVRVVLFLFISELVIKLVIEANNTLKEEEKETIEEMLTQLVQTCDDQSRDLKCLKSFTNNLIEIYKVLEPAVCKGSIVVSLRCPTLESLEHLWSDYPYGPARTFIAKRLRKSPYEGRTRWREQGRKKPSSPARIAYGPHTGILSIARARCELKQLCCYINLFGQNERRK